MSRYAYTIKSAIGFHAEFVTIGNVKDFGAAVALAELCVNTRFSGRGEIVEVRRLWDRGDRHKPLPETFAEKMKRPIGGAS